MAFLRDVRPEPSRRLVLAIASADLRQMLPSITVPGLLIYGQDDQRAPGAVAKQLHAAIPGSELVVLSGAGHTVNIETPDEFNGRCGRSYRGARCSPAATTPEKVPRQSGQVPGVPRDSQIPRCKTKLARSLQSAETKHRWRPTAVITPASICLRGPCGCPTADPPTGTLLDRAPGAAC